MSQIKSIIEILCKLLRSNGFSEYSAEDFRLAKYNKPEANRKMWKLLYELIVYNFNEKVFSQNEDLFEKITPETLITCCKNELLRRGYYCEDFLRIDQTYDALNASRSILLAIGWFLSSQNIINKFINNSRTPFDSEFAKENALEKIDLNELKKERDLLKHRFLKSTDNLSCQLNFLKWLNGNLSKKINGLFACEDEKSKLISDSHQYTENCGPYAFSSLSTFEIHLLKNPDKIDKYEKLLDENIELLNHLTNWLQNENIFWKWLESVIDEKLQEPVVEMNPSIDQMFNRLVFNISGNSLESLKNSQNSFKTNKDKLNRLVESEKEQNDFEITEKYLSKIDEYDLSLDETFTKLFNSKEVHSFDLRSDLNHFNLSQNRFDWNQKPNKQKDYQSLDEKIKKLEKTYEEKRVSKKNRLEMLMNECELLSHKLKNSVIVSK